VVHLYSIVVTVRLFWSKVGKGKMGIREQMPIHCGVHVFCCTTARY